MNGWNLIESQTANYSTDLSFVSGITNAYDSYCFIIKNLVPEKSGVNLLMNVSVDGGATYLNEGYQAATLYAGYAAAVFNNSNVKTAMISTGPAQIVTNGNNSGMNATLYMSGIASSANPVLWGQGSYWSSGNQPAFALFTGTNSTNSGVNAFKFAFNTGKIASGTVSLYGISS